MITAQTIAARFAADSTFEPAFTAATLSHEYVVYTCSHLGNCPCAGDERTTTVSYMIFEDGSVYCDDFGTERDFADVEALQDWLDTAEGYEAVASDEDGCYCSGDHCYC